jgi:hypothetical protein
MHYRCQPAERRETERFRDKPGRTRGHDARCADRLPG